MPSQSEPPVDAPSRPWPALRFALPLAALVAVWFGYGGEHLHDFVLGLGSLNEPRPDSMRLAYGLSALGIPACYLTYRLVLSSLETGKFAALLARLAGAILRSNPGWFGLVGAAVPVLIRVVTMRDSPVTDDESSYRFAAELLASGRLSVASPPMPVFFDNGFVVNDGRLYSAYFLGWPALLSIGVFVGLPALVNPVLSGLTTMLISKTAALRMGSPWGHVAAMFYLASPFVMVSAATQRSHTSSLFALALLLYSVERVASGQARQRWSRSAGALGRRSHSLRSSFSRPGARPGQGQARGCCQGSASEEGEHVRQQWVGQRRQRRRRRRLRRVRRR